jgi:hypothetical protein
MMPEIDHQFFQTDRQPLTEKEKAMYSPHHQRLYNQGMTAQLLYRLYCAADAQLGNILPMAKGIFNDLGYMQGLPFMELLEYRKSLEANQGPLATQLRLLARAKDLTDRWNEPYYENERHPSVEETERMIQRRAPTLHVVITDLRHAVTPYLGFCGGGTINFTTCKLRAHKLPTTLHSPRYSNIRTENVEEMLEEGDRFYTDGCSWKVELLVREPGGSVGRMYFDGSITDLPRYAGAWVYNHLEQDYYFTHQSLLDAKQLEDHLKALFTTRGWYEDTHQTRVMDSNTFAASVKDLGKLWQVPDFANLDLPEGYRWEDHIEVRDIYSLKPYGGQAHSAGPRFLSAKDSSRLNYMEWVVKGNPEDESELARQDRRFFYGRWKPYHQESNNLILHVEGCLDTGGFKISLDPDFKENQWLSVSDSVRFSLLAWLTAERADYLQQVTEWYQRVGLAPPEDIAAV